MNIKPKTEYIFVINTADYAGNWECELTAYITGYYQDNTESGMKEAEIFDEEMGAEYQKLNLIQYIDEDHGPAWQEIWPDGKSIAIRFISKPTPEELKVLVDRTHAFAVLPDNKKRPMISKIIGFKLLEETTTYTELDIAK